MRHQEEVHRLAMELRNCGSHFAVAVTGGGAPVCTSLFVHNGEGGGSSFMVDFQAPWGKEASNRLYLKGFFDANSTIPTGFKMPPAVSLPKAVYMARGMFTSNNCVNRKALEGEELPPGFTYPNLWGIALTAKLSYLNERVGREHQAHICAWRPERSYAWIQRFSPHWDRIDQEIACAEGVVRVMRFVAGIDKEPAASSIGLTRYGDDNHLGLRS